MSFKFTEFSDRVFTGLALVFITCLLVLSAALTRFDDALYDLALNLGVKPAPNDIVIIAIDEASLNSISYWPWPRSLYTELLKKLGSAQTQAIGLDIDYSEPQHHDLDIDHALAAAIAQAGNVVMPILLENPYVGSPLIKLRLPIPAAANKLAGLGRVNVLFGSDGVSRGIYLWQGLSADGANAKGLPHYAQTVLQVARQLPANVQVLPPNIKLTKASALNGGEDVLGQLFSHDSRKIRFSGPPGHFQRISYVKALSGQYPANYFRDKIVLIGVTAKGLGYTFPTPVSVASEPMSRVEFHANVIAAMRDQQLISDLPVWVTCLLSALLAIVPLLWLHRRSPSGSLLANAIYFITVMLFLLALPQIFNIWMAPSAVLIAILLAYPIWSWRRLDSAQVFLDKELQVLRNELASLGMEREGASENLDVDPMQARIQKVKLTVKHLREMHKGRADTLAFISHDIRAPLGAAMMLLSEFEGNKHVERMKRMLGRAYNMAEGFLQASKVEMANVNKFYALDMVGLVQQAVDDIYDLAAVRGIKFDTVFPEQGLWVRGDFGLLIRAVTNILINAVNYSPDSALIKVVLTHDHQWLTLEITDQGPGIPAAKVSKLFKRFSRVDAEHQSREGSGLGLYFVDVTITKHRGTVSVKSKLGRGSTFTISMPLERRKDQKPVEHDRRATPGPSFWDTM